MMLNRVVLPEPLGPMSAVMVPSATLREQLSTARTPPKTLVIPSTANKLLIAVHPLRRPAVARPHRPSYRWPSQGVDSNEQLVGSRRDHQGLRRGARRRQLLPQGRCLLYTSDAA